MEPGAVLRRFDAEMRADPPHEPGVERAWVDGVLRTTGAYEFIGWWDFPKARAHEIAAREAAFFAGRDVEWKVYSHDGPPGLDGALAAAGFAAGETETFLACEAARIEAMSLPPGVEVRQVADAAGLADYARVSAAAFGRDEGERIAALEKRLTDPALGVFVAYADGAPASAARLEAAPGSAFAGLYGGGVIPERRGLGLYRALVAARAAVARRRGFTWLTVDARETSRPNLERLGFVQLATVCGWTLAP